MDFEKKFLYLKKTITNLEEEKTEKNIEKLKRGMNKLMINMSVIKPSEVVGLVRCRSFVTREAGFES